MNIAAAVQLLNICDLVELAKWKIDKGFRKINVVPHGGGVIGTHLVYFPSYLNIRVLPQHLKDLAEQRITDFIESQADNQEFNNHTFGKQRWQGIVNYMQQEDWSDKLTSTLEYLEVCDSTRGTNFREVFKDLGSL